MKLLKFLLPCTLGAFCFGSLSAAEGSTAGNRDFQAVSDYIESKSAETLNEKGGNLKISGDVRTEWANIHTRSNGKKQRGSSTYKKPTDKDKNGRESIGSSEFNIEANLNFKYEVDRAFGVVRLQMANSGGLSEAPFKNKEVQTRDFMQGSGTTNKLALRKAFMGYNVWEQGTTRFDVQIGRQRLYDNFDSKIQFNSIFDGILAKYSANIEGISDFEGQLGAFVVDSSANHYGFVGEASFLNIADLGLDVKYSLINWDKKGRNRYGKGHPIGTRFINSQLTAAYNVSEDLLPIKTQLYGALLRNHDAKKNTYVNHKAANAFYLGCQLGKVAKKGDYAADIAYHYVEAQAVSERDISLMGRDTPRKQSLYLRKKQKSKKNKNDGGYANYKGYKLDGFYALTDNLTLNAYYQNISHASKKIGRKYHSSEFFLSALFAF